MKRLMGHVGIIGSLLFMAVVSGALADPEQGGEIRSPLFPADNWWNTDITSAPVDSNSDEFIATLNRSGVLRLHPDVGGIFFDDLGERNYGMPYVVVDGSQPRVTVQFEWPSVSDGVDHTTQRSYPFYPIPEEAIWTSHWIQGGLPGFIDDRTEDRHLLIVDRDNNYLYELFSVWYDLVGGQWYAGSGASFDMNRSDRRPEGWPSADESGLSILAGNLTYEEVYGPNEIGHALRASLPNNNGWVYPASNAERFTPGQLPLGARLRLRSDFEMSGRPPEVQKIYRAMQNHGLLVGTVAFGPWILVGGTFDVRWNNDIMNPAFNSLRSTDFEVIQLGWRPLSAN